MSKKPLPKIQRTKVNAPASTGYSWDNGAAAFSDPLELIGKKLRIRQKAAMRWKEQGQKRKEKRSSKSDFHRKHG